MKAIIINNHKIELFTDIRELPIKRYIQFQKNLLIDSGIGSTMEDVAKHFQKLFTYLNNEKVKEAIEESQNLYKNIYAVINGHSTKLTALSCLVKSINSKPKNDLTDEGLDKLTEELKTLGITWGEIDTQLEEVKKK